MPFALPSSLAALGRGLWLSLALAALIAAIACGGPTDANETDDEPVTAPDVDAAATAGDFRVRGELVFTTRADLAFEVPGEVGRVNATVGDMVSAGDILATLDVESLSRLEQAAAQAEFDLDAARDGLDAAMGLESDDPLVRARAESALARAESELAKSEVDLNTAEEALEDFQLQHDVSLGSARQAVADAEAGLDQAEENLSDFADSHSEVYANALEARSRARVALDAAEDAVIDFLPNHSESLSQLRNSISITEQELDQARDNLRDFDADHADRLTAARQMLVKAEADLEQAETVFEAFQLRAIDDDFKSLGDGENFDVTEFNALSSAVATARRAVREWEGEIADLETGPKAFDRAAAANIIVVLEEKLARLNRDLADLQEGPDQDELKLLEAVVDSARERLERTERDVAEAEAGIDQLELARLEAVIASRRLAVDSARRQLARLEDGPDQTELDALNQVVATASQSVRTAREARDDLSAGPDAAQVALAQSRIDAAIVAYDSAREDLENAILRAPFDGMVRLVTVVPGDIVNVDARIMQVVNPQDVTVLGLVETNYIGRLSAGTRAMVTLGAMPGLSLDAEVRNVSDEARTERGVISFPVIFDITVPQGVAIPPNPGLVTTTVIP